MTHLARDKLCSDVPRVGTNELSQETEACLARQSQRAIRAAANKIRLEANSGHDLRSRFYNEIGVAAAPPPSVQRDEMVAEPVPGARCAGMCVFVRSLSNNQTVCVTQEEPGQLTVEQVFLAALKKLHLRAHDTCGLLAAGKNLLQHSRNSTLTAAGVLPSQTLQLTSGMLRGGSRTRAPLIHDAGEHELDQSELQLTSGMLRGGSQAQAPLIHDAGEQEPDWSEEQLKAMTIEDMASKIKDLRTGQLKTQSKIFKFPRSVWDKVFRSKSTLTDDDKLQLHLLFQSNKNLHQIQEDVDCARAIKLASLDLLDWVSRSRNHELEYVVLSRVQVDPPSIQLSMKVNLESNALEDASSRQTTTCYLQIMSQSADYGEMPVALEIHALGEALNANCIFNNQQAFYGTDRYAQFLLRGTDGSHFLFTRSGAEGKQLLVHVLPQGQTKLQTKEVPENTTLYRHMMHREPVRLGVEDRVSIARASGVCVPQLISFEGVPGSKHIAFTELDQQNLFRVHLYSIDSQKEVARIEGAQAMLFAQDAGNETASLTLLADPIMNTYLPKERNWTTVRSRIENSHNEKKYPQFKENVQISLRSPELQVVDLRVNLESNPDFMNQMEGGWNTFQGVIDIHQDGCKITTWKDGKKQGFVLSHFQTMVVCEVAQSGQTIECNFVDGESNCWPIAQNGSQECSLLLHQNHQGRLRVSKPDGTALFEAPAFKENGDPWQEGYKVQCAATLDEKGALRVLVLCRFQNLYRSVHFRDITDSLAAQVTKPTKSVCAGLDWQLQSSGPVIAYTSIWMPFEAFLVHQNVLNSQAVERPRHASIVRLNFGCKIFCVLAADAHEPLQSSAFQVLLLIDPYVCMSSIQLHQPYKAGSFLDRNQYQFIGELNNRIWRYQNHLNDGNPRALIGGRTRAVVLVVDKVLLVRFDRQFVQQTYAPDVGSIITKVQPVIVSFDVGTHVLLVVQDLASKADSIVDLNFQSGLQHYRNTVVCELQDVAVLSLCRETQQKDYPECRQKALFSPDFIRSTRGCTVFAIDKAANLTKIRIDSKSTGADHTVKSVTKLPNQADLIPILNDDPSCILTDRTLVSGQYAIDLLSAASFQVIPEDVRSTYQIEDFKAISVGNTNAILLASACGLHVLQSDPGLRGSLFGNNHMWREVLSAHQPSNDTLLLQFRKGFQGSEAYWSLMNVSDSQLSTVPSQLLEPLSKKPWSTALSCMVEGGLTQLAMYHAREVLVLKINAGCTLQGLETYAIADGARLLQNVHGKLLSVTNTSDAGFVHKKSNGVGGQIKELECVDIGDGEKDYEREVAFLGDFFCYLAEVEGKNRLMIYPLGGQGQPQAVRIAEIDEVWFKGISIDACNPATHIRQQPSDSIDASLFAKYANRIQVTFEGETRVFQIGLGDKGDIDCFMLPLELDQMSLNIDTFVEEGLAACFTTELEEFERPDARFGLQFKTESSPFGNLVFQTQRTYSREIAAEKKEPFRTLIGIYRKHCRADCEMKDFKSLNLNPYALLSQFESESCLSLLSQSLDTLQHMIGCLLKLQEKGFFSQQHERVLKALATKLTEKRFVYEDCKLRAVSLLTPGQKESVVRDILIKIGRLSPNFSYFKEFNSQQSFAEAMKNKSPTLIQEFDTCFVPTIQGERIKLLKWPSNMPFLLISQPSAAIEPKDFEEYFENETDRQETEVSCRMLDLTWFLQDRRNFNSLSAELQGLSTKAYRSELVEFLIEKYWGESQKYIMRRYMIPNLIYIAWSVVYMKEVINAQANGGSVPAWFSISWLILWAYQVYQEACQLVNGVWEYIKPSWNYIDVAGLICVLVVFLSATIMADWFDLITARTIAAFGCFFTLLKLMDWLRLFSSTGFFVQLIIDTILDVRHFMLVLATTLMLFGMPLIMLDFSSKSDEEKLITQTFGNWLADLLYNQYLLALGEFSTLDNFESNEQSKLAFFLFIAATFITQLTILNIMITVMGESYNFHMENAAISILIGKLDILCDMSALMPLRSSSQEQAVYLFLTKPLVEQDDEDSWEGSLKKIIRVVEKSSSDVKARFSSKTHEIMESIQAMNEKGVVQDRQLKVYIDQTVKVQCDKIIAAINRGEQ